MNKLCVFLVLSAAIAAGASAQAPLSGSLRSDLASMPASHAEPSLSPALFDDAQPAAKKSAGLAFLYSLILPGAGEIYADGFDAGKYPLIAEGALWLTYGSMQYYGAWIRDDARNFAVTHAGITGTGMSDQFFIDVSNFATTYDYNEKKLRDRSLDLVYSGPQYAWRWDTEANREQFREQRVSSDRVFNNARFVVGGLIVNRIISAINAMRLVRRYNRSIESGLGAWRIESSLPSTMDGVQVSLVRVF